MGDAATALQRDPARPPARATVTLTVGYESNRRLQKIAGNCDFDGLGAGGRRFESGRPDHFFEVRFPRVYSERIGNTLFRRNETLILVSGRAVPKLQRGSTLNATIGVSPSPAARPST